MNSPTPSDIRQKLTELFSGYRAEWLHDEVFSLFTEPSYFPQLTAAHPCFLIGGRGTGKTTALRCLSYQGQEALRLRAGDNQSEWPYYGIYYRVNTNRVRAFAGDELSPESWTRLFAHYINLEFCGLITRFLEWYALRHPSAPRFSAESSELVSASLSIPTVSSFAELAKVLEVSRLRFEATINNIADTNLPPLSMQGAPIDCAMRAVRELPQFGSVQFFFLIDEYENLDDRQQRVMNSLIKHCGELYSFKVGVKELGFRERRTLSDQEQLVHPADYRRIDIADELEGRFADFAAAVCRIRLKGVVESAEVPTIATLLPELSPDEEADRLDIRPALRDAFRRCGGGGLNAESRKWFEDLRPLEAYVLCLRSIAEGALLQEKIESSRRNPAKWKEQFENYKHAYLFTIRRGKRGIRKYFAGWKVFCLLAAGNIRYLLELVDQALRSHIDAGENPFDPIPPDRQTRAAQTIGQRNLRELEGLSLSGAKLTRLVLGLGRVFQVMAEDQVAHTPEVNQFHLESDSADEPVRSRAETVLREGIVHLALLRYVASKLQDQSDIREFDYSIHPIFAAFFGFSHRRKRKIELEDQDLVDLVERPAETIRRLLAAQKRVDDVELPEQMELFTSFYALPN